MPFITKQYKFCSAHRYWNAKWSKDKNRDIFGEDIKLHGHNYLLDIQISGPINPESGFIIDLKNLDSIVKTYVIDVMDHSQIEKDIAWFESQQPSTENMVIFIWQQIAHRIPKPSTLYSIKLQETPTIFTKYFGPGEVYD